MAEVKRYDIAEHIREMGIGNCDELVEVTASGQYVLQSDYTALERKCQELEREVERLRRIEAAALKLVRCKGRYHAEQNYKALAEACGRKG